PEPSWQSPCIRISDDRLMPARAVTLPRLLRLTAGPSRSRDLANSLPALFVKRAADALQGARSAQSRGASTCGSRMQLARDRGSDGAQDTFGDRALYEGCIAGSPQRQVRSRNRRRTNKWQPCRSKLATPLTNNDKLCRVAVPRGVEPPTFGLGNRCSIL